MEDEEAALRRQLVAMERRSAELERFQRYADKPLVGFPQPSTCQHNAELEVELAERIHSEIGVQKTLEESLRAELLQCERQRAYIAVLEQAVRERLLSAHFPGAFEEFIAVPQVQRETEALKGQIEGIKALVQTIEAEEQSLVVTVDTLKPLERENSQLIQQIADNDRKVETAEEQTSHLIEETTVLREFVEKTLGIETKLEQLEAQDKDLRRNLAETQERHKAEKLRKVEFAGKTDEKNRYQKELKGLKSDREKLRNQLDSVLPKVESAEKIESDLEINLQILEKQRLDLELQLKSVQEEEIHASQSYQQLTNTLQSTQIQLATELESIQQLTTQDSKTSQMYENVHSRCQSLSTQIDRMAEAKVTLQSTLMEMRETVRKEGQIAQGQAESCTRESELLASKSAALVVDLKAAQRHISDLQTDLIALNTARRELPSALHSESQLLQHISEINVAISTAQFEVERLVQARSVLRARLLSSTSL